MKGQLQIVDWYKDYLEAGLCSKDLTKRHMKLKKKHELLCELHKTKMTEYEAEIWNLRQTN